MGRWAGGWAGGRAGRQGAQCRMYSQAAGHHSSATVLQLPQQRPRAAAACIYLQPQQRLHRQHAGKVLERVLVGAAGQAERNGLQVGSTQARLPAEHAPGLGHPATAAHVWFASKQALASPLSAVEHACLLRVSVCNHLRRDSSSGGLPIQTLLQAPFRAHAA